VGVNKDTIANVVPTATTLMYNATTNVSRNKNLEVRQAVSLVID